MSKRISAALAALACVASALHPGAAVAKPHHPKPSDTNTRKTRGHKPGGHPQSARAAKARAAKARAAHLARLAAKEKAAWRAHLAKVRDLPRKERLALKRHDRRLRAQVAAKQEKAQAVATARPRLGHRRHDPVRVARAAKTHDRVAAPKQSAHDRRLAQKQAAHARRAALLAAGHEAKVAQAQSQHRARLAKLRAAHEARLAKLQNQLARRALNHQARVAKLRAAHAAHLAAQRAHWVAMHGDGSGGRSIRFWQTVAAGVPVKVVTVDLNDSNVKVSAEMSRWGDGTSEPFRHMIERANPNVAVTGTFFSLDNLKPIGDIVIDGSLVHFGGMGTALCVTPDNRAEMVTCEWGRHHDWSPYDFVVACGPRLLRRGRIALDPRAERFKDRHMLAPNSRIAVGITRGNKLVFAMTHKPIYLGKLARAMRALGASEAMNLDAGTSTGFYYNGATLARPGRRLTNLIVVYGRKARYQRALDQLAPITYRRRGQVSQRS